MLWLLKQQSNDPKSECQHEPVGTRGAPASSKSISDITVHRKWLFRLIALVIVPLLALGGLEAALRLAGYGYRTSFFEKIRIGRQGFLANNENFGLRFFPPRLVRWSVPIMLAERKPPGSYRIFILGESAAEGDPQPVFGPVRYLEILLRERFPGEKFEIVNLGVTAINSHVIVPIARECARYQGDLWIIYMGNNEMVGPFGAASVFGAQAPPLGFVRLSLAIQQTRVGQLMMAVTRKLNRKTSNTSWGNMEMFLGNQIGPDDPRKEVVYQNFQRNLKDIVRAGLDSGAKIILNTVAVNLKDCPPFASLSATNLPAADHATYNQLCADGFLAEKQGNFEEAAKCFEQAAKSNPKVSDLQFHLAECLLHLTNFAAARERFQLACDYDALPFRADSRINDLIRQTGRQWAGPGLIFFDAVSALGSSNPAGICGQESFYEHVHFNFGGNYRLARAWAERVERLLPAAVRGGAVGGWASQETCERRLGLTDMDRASVFQTVIQRLNAPPLSIQSNNARRLEALHEEERDLRQRVTNTIAAVNAREIYLEAIKRAPDDYYLHAGFGNFLELVGDFKQATAQWRQVIELLPHNTIGYFQVGRLLGLQGQLAEAESALFHAVALSPNFAEACFELGNIHFAGGKFELALQDYERAWKLAPQDAVYCVRVGDALSKLNRRVGAIQRYRQALQLDPNCLEAHLALGRELFVNHEFAEAEREYKEVIRLQPANSLDRLNLGVVLAKQGQFDGALRQFEEALRLDPSNKMARVNLDQIQALKQQSNNPNPGR